MLDGFDLGLGTLFPFLTRGETDKRVLINTMGPFWDGNEVWLITAGGVTFAAFPRTYAVMFSGLSFVLVFGVHGLLWLATRSEGELQARAGAMAKGLWLAEALLAVVFLVMTWFSTPLWRNVLAKPYLLPLPLLAVAGLLAARAWMGQGAWWKAWFASSALILGTVLFGVAGLFPNLLPSSLDPASSLTAFNSASSPLTLKIMLGVVLCFLPVVIGYQLWVYLTFRDTVTASSIQKRPAY